MQRLTVIEIAANARHLAAAKLDDGPQRGIDLDAAASSTSLNPTEQNDAVTEIAKLATNDAQLA